jgi:hypothetical protein
MRSWKIIRDPEVQSLGLPKNYKETKKMASTTAYDILYNHMKTNFTVVNNNCEYTLGEYMLMKANAKKESTNLPAVRSTEGKALPNIINYVNDKLTVKQAPQKDKTIRKFPFRTTVSAFVSALITCALIFSYGIFTVNTSEGGVVNTVVSEELYEETAEFYDSHL